MGFFTWTDARHEPRLNRRGDFQNRDKIPYGGFAQVICPDGTSIKEPYYDGYGLFDGHDIYDLVAEWNRPYMKDLFRDIEAAGTWGAELRPIAEAYQDGGDAAAQAIADNFPKSNGCMAVKTEWKRLLGISIACVSKMEEIKCPYPIKIVKTRGKYKYEDLVPSLNCQ